jgi:hypothetical protein
VAYPAHQASSSEALVPLGRDGAVDVTNVSGRGFLSVEVEGYETSTPTSGGLVFLPEEWFTGYPRQWVTVLDTVMGQGEEWHAHRIGPGASLRVQAVPAPSDPENGWKYTTGYGARLAELSVTAYDATAFSRLTLRGGPGAGPGIATLDAYPRQRHTTTMLVPVAPDGTVELHNSAGWTDVSIEVEGFYLPRSPSLPADGLTTVKDAPVLDTRTGLGGHRGPVSGGSLSVKVAGVRGIPANATEVALRVVALDVRKGGDVQSNRSLATLLSYADGQAAANLVYLPVVNDSVQLDASFDGPVDLAAAVEGFDTV